MYIRVYLKLHVLFILLVSSAAAPLNLVVTEDVAAQTDRVRDWLVKYGYLGTPSTTKINFGGALSMMQAFHGFPSTGEIDREVVETTKMPRCGFPDTPDAIAAFHDQGGADIDSEDRERRRRYLLSGTKWDKRRLTYRFNNFSPDLSSAQQRDAFREAVKEWTVVTNIDLTEERGSSVADVQIRFAVGDHNDRNRFDGAGGALAHAYYPDHERFGGDIHFDEDELFSVDGPSGVDFFFVSLHELGHSLGLDHSSNPRSIMSPLYRGFASRVSLHKDDIEAIQRIYGVRVEYDPSPDVDDEIATVVAEVDDGHSPCTITYDAIVSTGESIYFFKDEMVWQTDPRYTPGSYGTRITDLWIGGPSRVDAAFMKPDRSVVLLNGNNRWEFEPDSLRLRPDYPKINEDLRSFPDSVDAAVYVELFRIVLVFKGALYWTLDPSTLNVRASGISAAGLNVPTPMNAAFSNNDQLFFLTGSTDYHVHNATTFQRLPGYPRNFNTEIAGELCGWCQTYRSGDGEVEADSPRGPRNHCPRSMGDVSFILLGVCLWVVIW